VLLGRARTALLADILRIPGPLEVIVRPWRFRGTKFDRSQPRRPRANSDSRAEEACERRPALDVLASIYELSRLEEYSSRYDALALD